MEFNKCSQCGSFFISTGKLCPNCTTKDTTKIQKLDNYIENYSIPDTIEELSLNTGIPTKDLTRYMTENQKYSNLF